MRLSAACLLILTCAAPVSAGEIEQAEAQRKKPLQRCDQLKDKAEIECLQKARERVVEARRKREAEGRKGATEAAGQKRRNDYAQ